MDAPVQLDIKDETVTQVLYFRCKLQMCVLSKKSNPAGAVEAVCSVN